MVVAQCSKTFQVAEYMVTYSTMLTSRLFFGVGRRPPSQTLELELELALEATLP